MSRYIWAPELHRIDGKWMIYFAAAQAEPDEHGVFDHRIYALANDAQNPMEGRFEECGQIQTGMESFSLDATSFSSGGQRYFVWAQRDYAIPGNSNLYIARMRSATELELPGGETRTLGPWEGRLLRLEACQAAEDVLSERGF